MEWCLLPATHPDVPRLLVSAVFGPASYAVQVTDLAHVWAETLGRREICMRGFQENTTIDPSCDNEQMAVFLGKIEGALGGAAGTRLVLAAVSSDTSTSDLLLRVTADLPGDLPPLRWPLRLTRQPAAAIASDLVLPLVQDRAARRRETAALETALRDKDAVIDKLVDKLVSAGAGLDTVFPALAGGSGRRHLPLLDRTAAEGRVKGLAPYVSGDARKTAATTPTADAGQLLAEAFGDAALAAGGARDGVLSAAIESWWTALGTVGLPLAREDQREKGKEAETVKTPSKEAVDDDDDDAFQTTPKKVEKTKTDEAPPRPAPTLPQKPKLGRLGALGKSKAAAGQAAASKADSDSTASEGEAPPTTTPLRPKPRGLGRIGQPSTAHSERPPTPSPPSQAERAISPPVRPPSKRGLGKIGGGSKTEAKADAVSEAEAKAESAAPGIPAAEPQVSKGKEKQEKKEAQETQAQAAQEARNERLQHVVEKHAAPVRKRRKF